MGGQGSGPLREIAAGRRNHVEGHGGPSFVRSDQWWLVQSLERPVRGAFALVPDFIARESGNRQTAGQIVIHAKRNTVQTGPAVVVMIERTFVVMRLLIVMGMTALAIMLLMGADVMRLGDREHTSSESGEDAENKKPCHEETHDGLSIGRDAEISSEIK